MFTNFYPVRTLGCINYAPGDRFDPTIQISVKLMELENMALLCYIARPCNAQEKRENLHGQVEKATGDGAAVGIHGGVEIFGLSLEQGRALEKFRQTANQGCFFR
ncbi:hypothetical protein Salat_1871500 [Sesamum alatum]|uniref:Uncharacterized protein n=1 Tax=Sesamum alatum TaxID=300844 RepID=A0AAE1Y396_9LAMI|nr:hypothetical protein Salat_1871500 [Sesamum alatum]